MERLKHIWQKNTMIIIAALVLILSGCDANHKEQYQLEGKTMGTTYHVSFVTDNANIKPDEVHKELDRILIGVNDAMSTYQKNSEITIFNRQTKAHQAVKISKDFATVLQEAIHLNKLTKGNLDVTVGPLVNLFGFGPDKRLNKLPSHQELAQVANLIGLSHISLTKQGDDFYLSKDNDKVYIDLSAIAKGFGVDKLAEYFEAQKITNYLVEIGGEIRVRGTKADNSPWKIAIEKPQLIQANQAQIIVTLDNVGMATSGNYRNYREDDKGNRLSHIIDPHTKRPISHNLASITVLAQSSMRADGLATGLLVMGAEKALALAKEHNLAIFMIVKEGDEFRTISSPAFDEKTAPTQH